MERSLTWKSPKIIFMLLLSIMALFGLLVISRAVNAPIEFADPNLEQVVREKIEKPVEVIYRTDLASVIELDASGRQIRRLEGLEALRRLAVLNLADNAVQDLKPLGKLRMLKVLNLANNQIDDLGAVNFEHITHLPLRELYLQDNCGPDGEKLHDITLLGQLTELEVLELRNNAVNDLDPLAGLSRLRELDLRGNNVEDLEPLRNLKQLVSLNLRENPVTDLGPLSGLVGLEYLNIHSNPIERGVDGLGNLTRLKTLIMRNVYIGEAYFFLDNLARLRSLNIRNTGITDVSVIGRLMSAGALQDDPEHGVIASIDLLENNPDGQGVDPYQNLRRYWDQIGDRFPLSLPYLPSSVSPVEFSNPSGFYEEKFYLTLTADEPDGRIFYTLDGSEPALTPDLQPLGSTQEYVAPILIDDRTQQPNSLSTIETGYWFPQHIPPNDVFKGNVIRAIVLAPGGARSKLSTQTYFIDDQLSERFSISVVSLVCDPDYLFDDRLGIYVPGDLFVSPEPDRHWTEEQANFFQRGLKWERPAAFQLFDPTGALLVDQTIGIRIHGGYTRGFNQKSLRLVSGEAYDAQGLFEFDFFPDLNNRLTEDTVDSFTSLILRNGGNDWRFAIFRDVLAHSLLEPTRLDIQGYLPVIVFINGEYWGIHNLRTRYDEHYFAAYYGLPTGSVVVLEDNGFGTAVILGAPEGLNPYLDMLRIIDVDFVENNYQTVTTLSDPQVYESIINEIDLENFITYNTAQVYFNNSDWPFNNVRFWRTETTSQDSSEDLPYGHDGKWRWMVLDVDRALRGDVSQNTLQLVTERQQIENYLFRALLENDTFRHQYINRFADLLNSLFREAVVLDQIDALAEIYAPEVEEQIHRWGQPAESLDAWLMAVDEMRSFATDRPAHQRQHLLDFFDLPGISYLNLKTDPAMGYIQVNSLNIQSGQPGVMDPADWSGIYFQGIPVHLKAHPLPGYHFLGWIGLNGLEADPTSPSVWIGLDEEIQITAVFEPE